MIIPESVTYAAERIKKELFCTDEGENPPVELSIRPHSGPNGGWMIEMNVKPPHNAMLLLSPTARRLRDGTVTWDLERNAILISGYINTIYVCFFITRDNGRFISTSRN